MANAYEMFKTDPTLETEIGIIVDYGDFRVRLARAGGANKRYLKLLEARMKPYSRQLATNTMDEKVATRILVEVFSETVFLGCDVRDAEKSTDTENVYIPGIRNEDGTIIDDTKENRINWMLALQELFADLRKQASDFTLFLAIKQDEIVKN